MSLSHAEHSQRCIRSKLRKRCYFKTFWKYQLSCLAKKKKSSQHFINNWLWLSNCWIYQVIKLLYKRGMFLMILCTFGSIFWPLESKIPETLKYPGFVKIQFIGYFYHSVFVKELLWNYKISLFLESPLNYLELWSYPRIGQFFVKFYILGKIQFYLCY